MYPAFIEAMRPHRRRPMKPIEKPICVLLLLIMLSSSAFLVLDELGVNPPASLSWQQCSILTNTVGYAWSVVLFAVIFLIGVRDEREPRFLSISFWLACTCMGFTFFGMLFVRWHDLEYN